MARKYDNARLRFFIGDVRDYFRLRRAMDGCEVVIHAAALKRIEVGVYNPDEMTKHKFYYESVGRQKVKNL